MSHNEVMVLAKDLREFRRLRNYYRRNFTNGESDETFVLWCEDMCAREREENHEPE